MEEVLSWWPGTAASSVGPLSVTPSQIRRDVWLRSHLTVANSSHPHVRTETLAFFRASPFRHTSTSKASFLLQSLASNDALANPRAALQLPT